MDNNQTKALFGSWVQAIGTTVSAVGNTPSEVISDEALSDLDLWGNVLQATGNGLVADSQATPSLDRLGNKVQSIGNLSNVIGFLVTASEEAVIKLNIKGELLQGVGGALSLTDALDEGLTMDSFYDIYGNLLQIIGNAMQAIAGVNELRGAGENELVGIDNELVNTIGSWVQAIGAILTALGVSRETRF